ncbi:unnamed protein product [Clonostachys solani]|uniref:Uncharacterized protein n=1 Tax=Clonostachys solani TaxID=160281 RepID=A0A9N9W963_9HYPO|nr:unnamed protein product [Clonostachys solani]
MVGATRLGLAVLVWLGLANQGLALSIDQATDDVDLVERDGLEPRLLFGSLEKTKAQMVLAANGKRDSEELDELDLEGRSIFPTTTNMPPRKDEASKAAFILPTTINMLPRSKGGALKRAVAQQIR